MSKHPLKTYNINIGGCSLRLKSQHDSDTLEEIVKVVEQQISKVDNHTLSMQKSFALCCLNVAEELVFLKRNLKQKLKYLESSTQSICSEMSSSSSLNVSK